MSLIIASCRLDVVRGMAGQHTVSTTDLILYRCCTLCSRVDIRCANWQAITRADLLTRNIEGQHSEYMKVSQISGAAFWSPATFQREMKAMFGCLPFVLIYLADILAYSRTAEIHEVSSRQTLHLLKDGKLYADLEICEIFKIKAFFLGCVVAGKEYKLTL